MDAYKKANELMGDITTNKSRFPFLWDHENYYYNMYHNETNWSDYVYQNAWAQNYRVNVQGGDDAAMYNFSLGFSDGEIRFTRTVIGAFACVGVSVIIHQLTHGCGHATR